MKNRIEHIHDQVIKQGQRAEILIRLSNRLALLNKKNRARKHLGEALLLINSNDELLSEAIELQAIEWTREYKRMVACSSTEGT